MWKECCYRKFWLSKFCDQQKFLHGLRKKRLLVQFEYRKFLGLNLMESEIRFRVKRGRYFPKAVQKFLLSKIHAFQYGILKRFGDGFKALRVHDLNRITTRFFSQHFTGIGKSTLGQMLAEIIPSIFHYISINEYQQKV